MEMEREMEMGCAASSMLMVAKRDWRRFEIAVSLIEALEDLMYRLPLIVLVSRLSMIRWRAMAIEMEMGRGRGRGSGSGSGRSMDGETM